MTRIIKSILLLAIFTGMVNAKGDPDFKPLILPKYEISKTSTQIVVDGHLDEAIWKKITPATNFSETYPGDNTRPPVKTEVFMAYDEDYIYAGFICYDDPKLIRANWSDRDNIFQDDYMGMIIDTYGTANWAYFIASNPLGIQGDTRISSTSGEDVNFDLIYKSAARITDNAYVVEMAIPFSSLRFPDKNVQGWKIDFWRTRPRESRATYSWASISRDNPCWFCQFGELKGLEGVKPGSSIDLIPSIVAGKSQEIRDYDDPNSGLEGIEGKGKSFLGKNADFGATLKWAVTPSLTVEGTFNPDFSQVESDAAQVNINQTFALFYPEKRPFFQEGSDLFKTYTRTVYTRTINDPIGATKVIGRWENATLAYLGAVDENTPIILPFEEKSEFVAMNRSLSNILRYKYDFGDGSQIGGIVTDRRWMSWETYDADNDRYRVVEGNGSGSVYGIDAKYRFLNNYYLKSQFTFSHTREPDDTTLTADFNDETFDNNKHTSAYDGESYDGNALYLELNRDARNWNFRVNYQQTSPTYRAANGFIFQNDKRQLFGWTGYTFYIEDSFLQRFTPTMDFGQAQNYNTLKKDEWIHVGGNLNLKGQTSVQLSYMWDNEHFKNLAFNGIDRVELYVNSNFSDPLKLGFYIRAGKFIAQRWEDTPVIGKGIENFEFWGTIKPWDRLVIRPSYTYSDAFSVSSNNFLYRAQIARIRFDVQFTRELALRLITQYVDYTTPGQNNGFNHEESFSIEPMVYYKINPFSVFYLGMTGGFNDYSGSNWKDFNSPGWTKTSQQVYLKFQYLFNI